jgi:hypothetical protein
LREESGIGASLFDDGADLAARAADFAGRHGRQDLAQALAALLPKPAPRVPARVPVEKAIADPRQLLGRLLETPAGGDPEELASQLLGQLGGDRERRLVQGLDLLRSAGLSQRAKWLLEGAFLGRLLDEAGPALGQSPPSFAEVVADFGLHAQQILARALGQTSREISPLPTEFPSAALRAGRMDLAGDFLRAAGADYFRDLRLPVHRELAGQLQAAWAKPANRLDLLPFGAAIVRLEKGRLEKRTV